mgnify:CR=1 FL=1
MENTKTKTTNATKAATANRAEEKEMLCVETKLGTLVAYPSKDPAHPGIYIDLKRERIPYAALISLVEYTEDDIAPKTGKELPAAIVSRTWGDAMADEYTDKVSVQNIERFFATED